MQSGLSKVRRDYRDYDFHKSFGSLGASTQGLPQTYSVDAGLWMPDQEHAQAFAGLDNIPALPFGCTDYTQADLCVDEDGHLYDPMVLENEVHANATHGADIRVSLGAARRLFKRGNYYSIQSSGILDWFDAVRVAMWITQEEKRAVSVGTPWFPEWFPDRYTLDGQDGILATPSSFSTWGLPWHNWKIAGWKQIGDQLYLVGKPWQGPQFGDQGWVYISRPLFNAVMSIRGTGAFTLSKIPTSVQTVDMNVIATLISFIRNLLAKYGLA